MDTLHFKNSGFAMEYGKNICIDTDLETIEDKNRLLAWLIEATDAKLMVLDTDWFALAFPDSDIKQRAEMAKTARAEMLAHLKGE